MRAVPSSHRGVSCLADVLFGLNLLDDLPHIHNDFGGMKNEAVQHLAVTWQIRLTMELFANEVTVPKSSLQACRMSF